MYYAISNLLITFERKHAFSSILISVFFNNNFVWAVSLNTCSFANKYFMAIKLCVLAGYTPILTHTKFMTYFSKIILNFSVFQFNSFSPYSIISHTHFPHAHTNTTKLYLKKQIKINFPMWGITRQMAVKPTYVRR